MRRTVTEGGKIVVKGKVYQDDKLKKFVNRQVLIGIKGGAVLVSEPLIKSSGKNGVSRSTCPEYTSAAISKHIVTLAFQGALYN